MEGVIDGDGDYDMMAIYDDKNNRVTPRTNPHTPTSHGVKLETEETDRKAAPSVGRRRESHGKISSAVASSNPSKTFRAPSEGFEHALIPIGSSPTLKPVDSADLAESRPEAESDSMSMPVTLLSEDFYDKWDNAEFLESLTRIKGQLTKYPSRLEKKVLVLTGFKSYMMQMLSGLLPWTFDDMSQTKRMPFLTDFYRRNHVLSRLSNGIIQVSPIDIERGKKKGNENVKSSNKLNFEHFFCSLGQLCGPYKTDFL